MKGVNMKIPQIIFVILMIAELLLHAVRHGQPREPQFQNYNFWIKAFDYAYLCVILWCGGFFK
jgi:hypothetical protein